MFSPLVGVTAYKALTDKNEKRPTVTFFLAQGGFYRSIGDSHRKISKHRETSRPRKKEELFYDIPPPKPAIIFKERVAAA